MQHQRKIKKWRWQFNESTQWAHHSLVVSKYRPEEKEIIDKKMELLGTHNQRAYLRKMAVDGYVVRVDMTDVKELAALLRTCSNNLNQIARRVNSTGNLYEEDIADLKTRYGELWGAFSSLLSKFEDL